MQSFFYGYKRWQLISLGGTFIILAFVIVSLYLSRDKGVELPKTVRITIPEGFNNEQIASLFDSRFEYFDHEIFLKTAPQGYMFPDTYYVGLYMNATATIEFFKKNFNDKLEFLISEIDESEYSLNEIILMASILEAEVKETKDRKIVAGILWKRLKINMPLQVDASPETYERRGFPSLPLNNPGLDSITSALRPTASPYFYFLTDEEGKVYYAETFEKHRENIIKYLK